MSPLERDLCAQKGSVEKQSLLRNRSHSNITVIKLCYHANLYLNGVPWLHKRALPLVPSHCCTCCNQSVVCIKTLRDNLLEDYYIVRPSEYSTFVRN